MKQPEICECGLSFCDCESVQPKQVSKPRKYIQLKHNRSVGEYNRILEELLFDIKSLRLPVTEKMERLLKESGIALINARCTNKRMFESVALYESINQDGELGVKDNKIIVRSWSKRESTPD